MMRSVQGKQRCGRGEHGGRGEYLGRVGTAFWRKGRLHGVLGKAGVWACMKFMEAVSAQAGDRSRVGALL